MAEDKKISASEVRKTMATALGAAFGFVIALVWNNVVLGGLATGGINLSSTATPNDWGGWGIGVVTALILTVFMILLIVLIGRWGSKAEKKQAT